MANNNALALIETALRERKLDRTLTSALPPLERSDAAAFIPFGVEAIDAVLRGGLPRGQVSEITGSPSSGRTTLLLQLLAAATRGGEIASLVDTCDRLEVASAAAAGIDLDRLLWIRGESFAPLHSLRTHLCDRVLERAIKALTLVLQAGGFAIVAIDLADVHPRLLRSLPFTTWLRLQRIVEGSDTACLLVTPEPLARSAGGLTVLCTGQTTWSSEQTGSQQTGSQQTGSQQTCSQQTGRGHRVTGLETEIRVLSPRRRVDGEVRFTAVANDY